MSELTPILERLSNPNSTASGLVVDNEQGAIADTVDALQKGVYDGMAGIAEFVGAEETRDWANNKSAAQIKEMSQAGRDAMQKQFFQDGDNGLELGEAWQSPRAIAMQAAHMLGLNADILLGGSVVKGGRLAVTGLGKHIRRRLSRKIKDPALLDEAARHGTQTFLANMSRRAGINNVPEIAGKTFDYGLATHAVSSGLASIDIASEINAMDYEDLVSSQSYTDSVRQIHRDNPQASPTDILEAARQNVIDRAQQNIKSNPALLTANFLIGGLGGVALEHLVRGVLPAGAGIAAELVTEGIQGGTEQYAGNVARQEHVDHDQSLSEGVLSAGLNEAVAGAGSSAVVAGTRGVVNRMMKPKAPLPESGANDINNMVSPTVPDTITPDTPVPTQEPSTDTAPTVKKRQVMEHVDVSQKSGPEGTDWMRYFEARYRTSPVNVDQNTGEVVSGGERPAYLMTREGKPFANEKSARQAASRFGLTDYEVKRVGKGVVMSRPTEQAPSLPFKVPAEREKAERLRMHTRIGQEMKARQQNGEYVYTPAAEAARQMTLNGEAIERIQAKMDEAFIDPTRKAIDKWNDEKARQKAREDSEKLWAREPAKEDTEDDTPPPSDTGDAKARLWHERNQQALAQEQQAQKAVEQHRRAKPEKDVDYDRALLQRDHERHMEGVQKDINALPRLSVNDIASVVKRKRKKYKKALAQGRDLDTVRKLKAMEPNTVKKLDAVLATYNKPLKDAPDYQPNLVFAEAIKNVRAVKKAIEKAPDPQKEEQLVTDALLAMAAEAERDLTQTQDERDFTPYQRPIDSTTEQDLFSADDVSMGLEESNTPAAAVKGKNFASNGAQNEAERQAQVEQLTASRQPTSSVPKQDEPVPVQESLSRPPVGIPKLQERVSSGEDARIDVSIHNDEVNVDASGVESNDPQYKEPLALTKEETAAVKKVAIQGRLDETTEDREATQRLLQNVTRPAVKRAIAQQSTPSQQVPVSKDKREPWEMSLPEYVNQKNDEAEEKYKQSKATLQSDLASMNESIAIGYVDKHPNMDVNDDGTVINRYKNKVYRFADKQAAAKAIIKRRLASRATPNVDSQLPSKHKKAVEQAIQQGNPVPSAVLEHYPDLAHAAVQDHTPTEQVKPAVKTKTAYHGTLAKVDTLKAIDSGTALFGPGVYLSTSKDDAKTYGSTSPVINRDLSGRAEHLAKTAFAGESDGYNKAKKALTKDGGRMIEVDYALNKPLVIGDKGVVIEDESAFRLALAESDITNAKKQDTIIRLLKKHAGKPEQQLSMLMQMQATRAIRQYASIKQHDGIVYRGAFAPVKQALKQQGIEHVQILDESAIKAQRTSALTEQDFAQEQAAIDAEFRAMANEAATSPTNDRPEPTDAQKAAGNYKKGHVNVAGLDISIENPKGSKRAGKDDSGKAWEVTMANDYGDIKGTKGADNDPVDVFIGDNLAAKKAYIVNQINPKTGEFDEHKVMLGFDSAMSASDAYHANYEKSWRGMESIVGVPIDTLKTWLKEGDTTKSYPRNPIKTAATAPEHVHNQGKALTDTTFDKTAYGEAQGQASYFSDGDALPLNMSKEDFNEITNEWAAVFADPKQRTITAKKVGDTYITPSAAKARIDDWKAHVDVQYQTGRGDNAQYTVLSLFDRSGEWSKPYEEAGYNVIRFDIQDDAELGDVMNFSVEFFTENFDIGEVYAILAACPCTDFASSGARWFKDKDADGRTEASKELVFQTMRTIEYFRPNIWALENPVGRIERLTGLPKARMTFEPHHFGAPYTKKTILWGNFNPDLPTANVEPTEGSKMHTKYGGKSLATKNARSETPEGFSYAFFMANNRLDDSVEKRLTDDMPEISGAIKQAVKVGMDEDDIREAAYEYGNYNPEQAAKDVVEAINAHLKATQPATSSSTLDTAAQVLHDKQQAALQELSALIKRKKGTLNSGVDPEVMMAVAKVGGYTIAKGAVKFSQWVRDVIMLTRQAGIDDTDVVPHLKEAYGAITANPEKYDITDDLADQMDLTRQVAKVNLENILKEVNDVPVTRDSVEPAGESGNTKPQSRQADGTQSDTIGQNAGQSKPTSAEKLRPQRVSSVPVDDDTLYGAPRPDDVFNEDGAIRATRSAGDTGESGRGDSDNDSRISLNDDTAPATQEVVSQLAKTSTATPTATRKAQWGNTEDIKNAVPILMQEQADDIALIEQRFFGQDNPGYGYQNTNGTGTGKTFVGLGLAKRFTQAGYNNILIVVPNDGIARQWVKAGSEFFAMDITLLGSGRLNKTVDPGKGVTIATYATFGQNNALINERDKYDLIIPDESQNFMANQQAKNTHALTHLRAITNHEDGRYARARIKYSAEQTALDEKVLEKKTELLAKGYKEQAAQKEAQEHHKDTQQEIDTKVSQERDRLEKIGQLDTKVLFLSATPWPYVKNLAYAEGFVFNYTDYGDKYEGGYDNAFHGHNNFYIQNFGYRWRYHKLNRPGPEVDESLMERTFHENLKAKGVMNGRTLEVEQDYGRDWVKVETSAGEKLDDLIDKWWNHKVEIDGSDYPDRPYAKLAEVMRKRFDYVSRIKLTEAIKAEEAVERVQDHLKMGRKVVIFHSYNVGGTNDPVEAVRQAEPELLEQFENEFPNMTSINFGVLRKPLDVFAEAFGDKVRFYNGDVSNKDRAKAKEAFNQDDSGVDVIVVQQDAGEAGLSLHDVTGQHQRVLINIGMPVKPTQLIQIEGRIYRVGVQTDAHFEYLTTGTAFEREVYASKISSRASTAENLAMGEMARSLKDSIAEGYLDAAYKPAQTRIGKGGKQNDRPTAIDEWDKAISLYYANLKRTSSTKSAEGSDYFATPEPLGKKMVEWAQPKAGTRMLEPSVGHGAIGRWFPGNTRNRAIEPSYKLFSLAQMNFNGEVLNANFEELKPVNKVESVVMNPPFGKGGKLAYDHIEKAVTHLTNGGRIVALVPDGPMANKRLDKFLEDEAHKNIYQAAEIDLPQGVFERAGTGVKTKIIILDRFDDSQDAPQFQRVNFTGVADVKELFERIKDVEVKPRKEATIKQIPPTTYMTDQTAREGRYPVKLNGEVDNDIVNVLNEGATTLFDSRKSKDGRLWVFETKEQLEDFKTYATQVLSEAEESGVALNFPDPKSVPAPLPGQHDNAHFAITGETYTTKKSGKKYVITEMLNRQERETYQALKTLAKDYGGWARGQQFMFKTNDDAAEFNAQAAQLIDGEATTNGSDDIPLSLSQKVARGNVNKADAIAVVARLDSRIANRGTGTVIVNDAKEYPNSVKQLFKSRPELANAPGFLHDGKAYINLSEHRSLNEVEETYIHERLRHFGFRQYLGQDVEKVLVDMHDALGRDNVVAMLEKQGVSTKAYIEYYSSQPSASPKDLSFGLMDELLAYIEPTNAPITIKQKLRVWLTKLKVKLRKMGFEKLVKYNAKDMLGVIHGAVMHLQSSRYDANRKRPNAKNIPAPMLNPTSALKQISASAVETAERMQSKGWKNVIKDPIDDSRKNWLALIPRRYLDELSEGLVPSIKAYMRRAKQMDADRNELMNVPATVVDEWRDYASQRPQEAKALAELMHQATIASIDPSKPFEVLRDNVKFDPRNIMLQNEDLSTGEKITPEYVKERTKVLREMAKSRSGDGTANIIERIKHLNNKLAQQRNREAAEPEIRAVWEKLSSDGKKLFERVRDAYIEQHDEYRKALESRIFDEINDQQHRKKFMDYIRQLFETQRIEGPYFPLARFGDYFAVIKSKDDKVIKFSKFETKDQRRQWIEKQHDLLGDGERIELGKMPQSSTDALKQVDPKYHADVMMLLDANNVNGRLMDEVNQIYLERLPASSMRKQFIHRKKTAGFNHDAMRAFSHNMFHGAYQLARLRHSHKMQVYLDDMKDEAGKSKDPDRAMDIYNEMVKRHDWAMNPTSAPWTAKLTSLGFAWYLGVTPAAALVNTTQTVMVGLPVLGSRYGFINAAKALLSASMDFMKGGLHVDKALTDPAEQKAFEEFKRRGLIEKTLAHDLAGVSEGGLNYSSTMHKVMTYVSFFFHHAERYNREVTAMAAYRLARAAGESEPIEKAEELTLDSHFDYSNAERARFMQNDAAKVLLLFRQHSLNMTYRLLRDTNNAMRGENKEVKRIARRQLAGILGMTGLFAGTAGLPFMYTGASVIGDALFGDEDEPWEFDVEFRLFLAEHIGESAAHAVVHGVADVATGANISGRIGLNNLWFREADPTLEGRGLVQYYTEQMLGPIAGMAFSAGTAWDIGRKGQIARGIEYALPKALKDTLRAMRYADEGVTNLRGDALVEDTHGLEEFYQLMGFTPTRVSERYEQNRAIKGYEKVILHRRQLLINQYAAAKRMNDRTFLRGIQRQIDAFNQVNPEVEITRKTLLRSMRTRQRYSDNARHGIQVDERLQKKLGELNFISA